MLKINLDFENQAKKIVEKEMKAQTQSAFVDLVNKTPVDTGNARDSWEYSFYPAGIKSYTRITNDAEYIEYLNKGHSSQAGAFWIEETLLQHGLW